MAGEIENGTIIDLNYGIGDGHYLYYNGSFYPTDRPVTKGWGDHELALKVTMAK